MTATTVDTDLAHQLDELGLDFPIPCQHPECDRAAIWLVDVHESCPCRVEIPMCQLHLDRLREIFRIGQLVGMQAMCHEHGPIRVGPISWRPLHGDNE